MENERKLNRLEENINKLNDSLVKNRWIELSEIMGNWKKLIWRNFISGISKGVGIGIGVSIISAIIIITMQRIITLNIPVLSNYIADIVEIVETKR